MATRIIFMSDLHLADAGDAASQRVLDFWQRSRGQTDRLYLLGDIFDFNLGYQNILFSAYFPFLRALADLVDAGTEVVYLTGNHDPAPEQVLTEIGVTVHSGPLGVDVAGHQVWLEHGDVVDPRGIGHRLVCQLARNPFLLSVARAVHPEIAWRASRLYAMKRHSYDEPFPAALLDEWFTQKAQDGFDVVVMGHYHRAVSHRVGARQFFALGDWVKQFTYLVYDGSFRLMRDRGDDADPIELPLGDHAPT